MGVAKKRSSGVLAVDRAATLGPDALRDDSLHLTYRDVAGSATDASSYTFAGMALGPASSTRTVIVAVTRGGVASTGPALYGVTIGGVTATVAVATQQYRSAAAIVYATVPTGTTGDVVVTLSGSVYNCGIAVYTAPVPVAVNDTGVGTSSISVTEAVGGASLVCGHWGVYGAWSGIAEAWELNIETTWRSAGGYHAATAAGTLAVSNSGVTYPSMAGANFVAG